MATFPVSTTARSVVDQKVKPFRPYIPQISLFSVGRSSVDPWSVRTCSDYSVVTPKPPKFFEFQRQCVVEDGGSNETQTPGSPNTEEGVQKTPDSFWEKLFEGANMDGMRLPKQENLEKPDLPPQISGSAVEETETAPSNDVFQKGFWSQVFRGATMDGEVPESSRRGSKPSNRRPIDFNSRLSQFASENPFLLSYDLNEDEYSGLTWDPLTTGKGLDTESLRQRYGNAYFRDREPQLETETKPGSGPEPEACDSPQKYWDAIFSGVDETRLGPKDIQYMYQDHFVLQSKEHSWCGLCGTAQGWMVCGACQGEGYYATKPGLGGVKDEVRMALCKTCYGRRVVPCVVCGLPEPKLWLKWQEYAKRHPKK